MAHKLPLTVFACAAAAAFLQTTPARANGRFPNANQLIVDPSDPQRIVLRATFGVVQSTDGGLNWRWICEGAIGYSGIFDPAIAVTGNGTVLAGLPVSTSRSADRGCSWPVATASSVSVHWVIDLAVDRTSPSRAIALIAPTSSARGFQATLAESRDHGQTWGASSALTEDFSPTTAEIAPSKPTRIYAVGKGPHVRFGEVARSDDGGATWITTAMFELGEGTLGEPELVPFLSTIDPLNPDGLYVRISDPKGDRLVYSADGGGNWVTLFTGAGELLGFALSADGKKIAVGGPKDGIHIATSGPSSSFAKVSTAGARCLTYAGDVLWVCGNEAVDGYTVGNSTDTRTRGRPAVTWFATVSSFLMRGRPSRPLRAHQQALFQRTCGSVGRECALIRMPSFRAEGGARNGACGSFRAPPLPPRQRGRRRRDRARSSARNSAISRAPSSAAIVDTRSFIATRNRMISRYWLRKLRAEAISSSRLLTNLPLVGSARRCSWRTILFSARSIASSKCVIAASTIQL